MLTPLNKYNNTANNAAILIQEAYRNYKKKQNNLANLKQMILFHLPTRDKNSDAYISSVPNTPNSSPLSSPRENSFNPSSIIRTTITFSNESKAQTASFTWEGKKGKLVSNSTR